MASSDPVADFFSSWENYRAVIESDAMEHVEIYHAIHRILMSRTEPFSLLDLGCGDAAGTAPALAGTTIAHYAGVDIAAPALELAAASLKGLPASTELVAADLLDAVRDPTRTFDVVLACFAVHHLQTPEKREFLSEVHGRLRPGGELILVDLVRADGTTRPDFLEYQDARIRTWPIGSALQERTVDHANGFDFPEERATQPRWAQEIGYREVIEFYRGGEGTQAGWRMLR